MVSKEDSEKILNIISRYYGVKSIKFDENEMIVNTEDIGKYPQEYFSVLVKELEKYRYVAFTRSRYEIIVIKTVENGRRNFLKAIMGLFTVVSLFYVGYSYVFAYFGTGIFLTLAYTAVSFVLPILLIIASREAGRYIAFKRNNMKYTSPILIPDPIGMGTMGILNNSKSVYPNRKSMIEIASFSLIFGFIASLIFVAIGDYLSFMNPLPIQGVRSPLTQIGSPLIFQLIMKNIIPSNGILYPVAYAGWIGIVVNSFNALPLGYLDGGLISSAYLGKNSVYVSYASIIAVVGMSILYPSWLVLPVFALIVGIRGPEPLNNIAKTNLNMKALAAVAIVILFIGIVPVSYHPPPSEFSVHYGTNECAIWKESMLGVNETNSNATFTVNVTNLGSTPLTPAFAISPSISFYINSTTKTIDPGKNASYNVVMPMKGMKFGIYSYTLDVYSVTGSDQIPLKVYYLNVSGTIVASYHGMPQLILTKNFSIKATETVSIMNNQKLNDSLNVVIFSTKDHGYSASVSRAKFMIDSEFPYFLNGGQQFDVNVISTEPQTVYVLAYDQNYSAAIAMLNFES
ncbi:MAG: site-2 protease family protein, partial [Thermoplasmata archaeon]